MKFNVFRPLEDDYCTSQHLEASGLDNEMTVGFMRTRASYWLRPKPKSPPSEVDWKNFSGQVGIMLLDPTPRSGSVLWGGPRNWTKIPTLQFHSIESSTTYSSPPTDSIFNEYVYWACQTKDFNLQATFEKSWFTEFPTIVLLHLMCAQWLTLTDYLETRLNQGDLIWRLSTREPQFGVLGEGFSVVRTLLQLELEVPKYQEMMRETLYHLSSVNSTTSSDLPVRPSTPGLRAVAQGYVSDFEHVLRRIEDVQRRIRINLKLWESKALEERSRGGGKRVSTSSHYARILIWMGIIFLPLTCCAKVLSIPMTTKSIAQLGDALKVLFAVGIPLVILLAGIYWRFSRWR